MYRSLILLGGGLVTLWTLSLHAQDAILGELYGRGVHTYFSRDYAEAHRYLTKAIDGGTKDPRAHYFRGMTYLRLGREEEARLDFQKGAELESGDVDRFFNVAKSLERVQGSARLLLEEYRVEARMAARQRAEQLHKARYDAVRQEEQSILQEQIGPAPQLPPDPGIGPSGVSDQSLDDDPFEAEQPGDFPFDAPADDQPLDDFPPAQPPAAEPPGTEPPNAEPPLQPAIEGDAGAVLGGMMRALGKAAIGGKSKPPADPGAPAVPDPFSPAAPATPETPAPGGGAAVDPFAPAAAPAVPETAVPETPAPGGGAVVDPFAPAAAPTVPEAAVPETPAPGGGAVVDPFDTAPPAAPKNDAGEVVDPFAS